MIAIYVVGKQLPVIFTHVRFTSMYIEGVDKNGNVKRIQYEQIKETEAIEAGSDTDS